MKIQTNKNRTSGTPGVSKVTNSWQDCTLGDLITLQRGFDLPIQDRKMGSVPVFASTGPIGTHSDSMVKGPGVVIGRSGSLGGAQFISVDFWPLNTTLWIKDFKGNDPRFIYYLLKTIDFGQFNVGSGVPTLNRNHIHPMPIRCPQDINAQRAIAKILGTLDDKIELNRRMNETLEAISRAIFKSWFVDPIESEIPKGWCEGTINDFADLNPESWSEESVPNEIEYVDLASTKWGKIEVTTTYTCENAPSRAQRILKPGDSIVGTVRPGNGSFAFICQTGLTGSTGFAVLRPRKSTYKEFVYLATTSSENIEWLSHLADGAAYPAVRPNVVVETPVIRPTEDVVTSFSKLVGPLLATIALNNQESRTLAAIRDALLPRLLSGEIRIEDTTTSETAIP